GARLAGDDELMGHDDRGLRLGEEALDALDHRRAYPSFAVAQAVPAFRCRGQLRRDDEQLALESEYQLAEPGQAAGQRPVLALAAEVGPGKPERRDRLADRAERLGPRVVLRDARAAIQEPSRAVVATPGSDRRVREVVRGHHMRPASRGSQRSARSVTFTSCSTTDSACS